MAVHRDDRLSSSFNVDTSDLKGLIKDLKRAGPAATRGMRTAIKASAEIVAVEARAIASEHSKSIPPTVKARTYLSGTRTSTASVTAGRGVPLAALYEVGNKGSSPTDPEFRHPVFARGTSGKLQQTSDWVGEKRYPFLLPAAVHKGAEVQKEVEKIAGMAADIVAVGRL
jgi:hypothetical protein